MFVSISCELIVKANSSKCFLAQSYNFSCFSYAFVAPKFDYCLIFVTTKDRKSKFFAHLFVILA